MRRPPMKSGFYWVRFEGEVQVGEYRADLKSWRFAGAREYYSSKEICELLSLRLVPPKVKL